MIPGAIYEKIDDQGLHVQVHDSYVFLNVDTIVICAGQVSLRNLYDPLEQAQIPVHLIGGADQALELDAKRAIDQASRLAAVI